MERPACPPTTCITAATCHRHHHTVADADIVGQISLTPALKVDGGDNGVLRVIVPSRKARKQIASNLANMPAVACDTLWTGFSTVVSSCDITQPCLLLCCCG
jgi:hypothetical protein